MFNPFKKDSGKKKQQAKDQLASLGLDPSIFDDPEMNDEDEQVTADNFEVEEIPQFAPVDVSSILDVDDVHVELEEGGMDIRRVWE